MYLVPFHRESSEFSLIQIWICSDIGFCIGSRSLNLNHPCNTQSYSCRLYIFPLSCSQHSCSIISYCGFGVSSFASCVLLFLSGASVKFCVSMSSLSVRSCKPFVKSISTLLLFVCLALCLVGSSVIAFLTN